MDPDAVQKIRSVPGEARPVHVAGADFKDLEEYVDPHLDADAADRELAEHADDSKRKRQAEDVRITNRDLRLYGYHPGRCLKCDDLRLGVANSWRRHSEECRLRIYEAYRQAKDPKFKSVEHLFQDIDQSRPGADPLAEVDQDAPDLRGSLASETAIAPDVPLRNSDDYEDDEPGQPGAWDPERFRDPEFQSFAEQDANDPDMDMFMPSEAEAEDDDDMNAAVGDDSMMDALLNAGVDELMLLNLSVLCDKPNPGKALTLPPWKSMGAVRCARPLRCPAAT